MERLYKAIGTITDYFVADDSANLTNIAYRCLRETVGDHTLVPDKVVCREVISVEELGDDVKLIPWFGLGDLTCGQVVESTKSYEGRVVDIEGRKYKLTEIKEV
jgi:hypothetical protein